MLSDIGSLSCQNTATTAMVIAEAVATAKITPKERMTDASFPRGCSKTSTLSRWYGFVTSETPS